jgi:lycopene beta-cyclase
MPTRPDPLIVLGAGCAGLSLAAALVREGVREQVLVVDRRTTWPDDRTWCFWDTGDVAHADLARHSWGSWEVVTPARRATAHARRHPYVHLKARDLYDRLLIELDAAPNVELLAGRVVRSVTEDGDGVTVRTDAGVLRGARAWDAMGGVGPLLRGRAAGAVELRQAFLGQEVELGRPAFRPGVATLMDFRVGQEDGLHFVYVLPFSPTRALVEDTHIGTVPVAPARRRETLRAYLAEHHGGDEVTVLAEERGNLAMSTWAFPATRSPRLGAVGAAAGAVRPSSGYAFARLQRHVAAVAAAVASGRPAPAGPHGGRRAVLDRIFLEALAMNPKGFPEHFRALAAGVPGDVFARFMSDRSSPLDEARVMRALPVAPFARAAWSMGGVAVPTRGRGRRVPLLDGAPPA